MDTDGASLFWFVIPGLIVPAALVVAARISPTAGQLQRWTDSSGVVLTASNEPMVRDRLGRARRFRSSAAFPFWWLAFARGIDADFPELLATPLLGLVAYVVGGTIAELTRPIPPTGTIRRAPLVTRGVEDFEPGWVRRLPWVLCGAAASLILAGSVLGEASHESGRAVAALAVAMLLAASAQAAASLIARRPQPGDDPDVLTADDALRATGIALGRSGAAVVGLVALDASLGMVTPNNGWWALIRLIQAIALLGALTAAVTVMVRQESWGHRPRFRQSLRAVLSP